MVDLIIEESFHDLILSNMIEAFNMADLYLFVLNYIGDKCRPPQGLQNLWAALPVLSDEVLLIP